MWTLPGLLGSNTVQAEPFVTDLPINYLPDGTISDYKKIRTPAPVENPDNRLRFQPLGVTPVATDILAPDFAEMANTQSLSDLWNATELAISPESEGEHIVNQIYGYDEAGNALTPPNITPPLPPQGMLSLPHVYVSAKNAVLDTVDSVKTSLVKYGIILAGVLVAAIFVYAFVGAKARRLA